GSGHHRGGRYPCDCGIPRAGVDLIRAVLDTNVLLSAFISEGPPFQAVGLAFDGHIQIVFSRATFGEFSEILMTRGPFSELTRETRGAYIAQLSEVASWVKPEPQPVKCRDPGEQPFLDLAVAAGADYRDTGDPDIHDSDETGELRQLA